MTRTEEAVSSQIWRHSGYKSKIQVSAGLVWAAGGHPPRSHPSVCVLSDSGLRSFKTPFIGLGPTPGPLLLVLVRPISKESHSEALGLESHPMDLEDTQLSSSSPAPWADTASPQPVLTLPEPSPSKSRHGERSFLNII